MSNIDPATTHPRDVAAKLGIPVYETPRRPPTLPLRLPDSDGKEVWLGPGGDFWCERADVPMNGMAYSLNQTLIRLAEGKKPVVLMNGISIDNGERYWVVYFERPKSYLQSQIGLKKLWDDPVGTLAYYGVEPTATVEGELESLNLAFFAPRTITRPPRQPFRPGLNDPNAAAPKRGRTSSKGDHTKTFRQKAERPPKPPKPPKAPKPPKPPKAPKPPKRPPLIAPVTKKTAKFPF